MPADTNQSATPSIGTEQQPAGSGVGPWNTAERAPNRTADNHDPAGAAGDRRAGTEQFATEQARAIWREAKDTARSELGHYKHTTAKGIADLAAALQTSARELESNRQPAVARIARSAADGLEQLSGAIDRRDLDGLVHEVESFARRQPLVFLGAATAAGFLAVRFLKSTSQPER